MTERAYPSHRAVDVTLRDGSTVHVRPTHRVDAAALARFFEGLSDDARTFRFFSAATDYTRVAKLLCDTDYRDRYGIVATKGADGEIVGHAYYGRANEAEAEVAFAVGEELRGRGVATILLAHLAEAASEVGFHTLRAEVMPSNRAMIEVFRESGFPIEVQTRQGVIEVTFPVSLSDEAVARFEARDRVAAAAAVRHALEPSSIAVIGASHDRDKIGGRVFFNLVSGGFAGPVYPVNAGRDAVQSVKAYASIGEVPERVELAVISVPAAGVVAVARECAEAGVSALVVLSAGFSEVGGKGARRQAELVAVCHEFGLRLVGPNCLGIGNTAPEVALNASFGPKPLSAGNVGMMTQSGALGLALIEQAEGRGIGISSFVSVGNKADISGNDLLAYWEEDESTDVIMLYLESFGNPVKFGRLARRIARQKPILAVKSGRGPTGARAAGSHTGALLAASDVTVDALFRQSGVIRTDGLAELLDVGALLAKQPLPGGRRVGIVSNAGGPAIMCADACEALGLEVPTLAEEVQAQLAVALPPEASLSNPVDMIATATPEQFQQTIEVVAESGEVDAVIAIFIEPLLISTGAVIEGIEDAVAGGLEMPVLAVLMSPDDDSQEEPAKERRVPSFRYPESAAQALAHAVHYAAWRRRPPMEPPRLEVDPIAGAAAIAETPADGGWMEPEPLGRLLEAYGIPVAISEVVPDPEGAVEAARRIGGIVALKAVAPDLLHKTEVGAVRLGLEGPEAVASAAAEIAAAAKEAGVDLEGFLVQAMAKPGPELIVGVTHDPLFGALLACGAGGVEAELIHDLAVRLGTVNHTEAGEMLAELTTYPRLTGFRGSEPVDLDAIKDLLVRVSLMAAKHAEIRELDLNPVIASSEGALVVDARVRVEPAAPPRPWPVA